MSYAVGDAVLSTRTISFGVTELEDGSEGTVLRRSGLGSGDQGYIVDWGERVGHFRVDPDEIEPAPLQYDDPVQSPPHYDLPGGIQVIDLIRGESFLRGNALKYIFRAPHKGNELEDMKKSREYINWEIERLENEQSE